MRSRDRADAKTTNRQCADQYKDQNHVSSPKLQMCNTSYYSEAKSL